jgi:hypothetical protein
MKKMTMKETKRIYNHIIKVGYCELQSLLNLISPFAYTSGVYGWNADVYDFGDIAIVTGYRPFGDIVASCELCHKYEQKAKEIMDWFDDMPCDWDRRRDALYLLIEEFLEEVTR